MANNTDRYQQDRKPVTIHEGRMKKGGRNTEPQTPRPKGRPSGQAVKKTKNTN